ncbi:Ig-like domain-containing protein, partial [Pseudomonas sp. GD03869]|uniref:Ig-like domain-containing protein n=3 Tax=unclassified Pseudomonas TaxID=196821 RepID=UPI002448F56C
MFWNKNKNTSGSPLAGPSRSPLALSLEARMMFDGAVAATAVEAAATPSASPAADAPDSHDTLAAAPSGSADHRQEVVFIDGQVENYQQLLAGVQQGTEVVVLDPEKDGLKQIGDHLAGRSGIDAIHIVSHGLPGQITLGSITLDRTSLDGRAAELARIGASLGPDGDMLFYGCDVGSGTAGQAFVDQIALLTGADVAASDDSTGAAARGGDWLLEVTRGSIEAAAPFSAPVREAFTGRLFSGILDFNGADNFALGPSVTDGEAGSVDISGIAIEIYSAAAGSNVNSNATWGYYSDLFGDGPTGPDEGIGGDNDGFGTPVFVIRSQDGADFSFTGIRVVDYLGVQSQVTFSAYRDGQLLGSVTLGIDSVTYSSTFSQSTGLTASIFQNVDEIRITNPDAGQPDINGNFLLLDEIGVADAIAPPTLVSATFADNALKIGETSTVTFVFSRAVTGFTTADLTVPNGAISGLGSSDGGTTWTGTFTPNASVTDATNVITVDLAGVTSVSGGLAGSGTANSSNYAIDTQAPAISAVSAATANGHYVTGQIVDITVTFDDNVTVSGTPQLTLETGSNDRVVNYLSGSGTNTLTFRYTIQSGDTSLDLDYVSTSALALNGGSIRDSAGNDAILTLASPGTAGSLGANKAIVIDSAPGISNLNGDSVAWAGVGNTVMLDVGGNAAMFDAEFSALNSGNGNWSGASLTVQRAGTAVSADILGLNTAGALFTVNGGNLQSSGQTFATFTNTGGVLTITFTSSGTAATTALVQDVARHISYRSDTPSGDATMRYTLSDGYSSTTANVTVTSDTIYVTNAIDTTTVNVSDGVSFSEAIAIAAADVTGSQTIVIDASLAGQTVSTSAASALGESLTLNLDSASGVTLSGGTLSIGSGLSLNVVNGAGDTATVATALAGAGGLTKNGAGSVSLSGNNTYTGATSVNSGSLLVNGALTATSGVSVAAGATLGGSGSIDSNVTLNNGATLAPGSGVGTLTIDGNLTMASGSTLAIEINGTTAGTGYDRVAVNGTVNVSGATLAVTHGYQAGIGDSYTIIVNDAADAVTGTFGGIGEGGVFNAGGNATQLTASYIGGDGNDFTLTAPLAPTVTDVTSSTANGTYRIGDTVTITVTFDAAVFVTGAPTLQLETGTTDRTLDYLSGSGTNTLTFSYTVQAGDSASDLDYVSTSALALNGGTIRNGAGIDALLTLAAPGTAGSLGANKALVIDGIRPTASIVVSDTTLSVGEDTTVTITFNEAVTGLTTTDFSVANGTLSGLSSSDGGITWTATLTPATSVEDSSNLITLDNTGVQDLAGNTGTGSTDSNNYAIDTQRPTASVVVADSTLRVGETTTVTITFSEAVTGLTTADFSVANGALSNLSSSDGGITWTATLTPNANVTDTSNLITLDNTGVQDLAGNAGAGSTDSNNYAVDTLRPTATVVVADTALIAGETTTVTITFSEAVTGLTTADFTVANGTLSDLTSSDGGLTWTATLTPTANVTDASNLITLDNTGYTDAAGNTGTGTTDSNNYALDTQAPAVDSVSVPADGTYIAGQNLDFTVNFSENVVVDTSGGTPRIAITLDTGGTVFADYVSGSGTSALVFRLTVASGQADSNGIAVGSAIQANGGSLRDAAGNDAVAT